MKPTILAVIPVSGQDAEFQQGVPLLAGTSLLEYTFEAARESRLLDRVVVSTDSRSIADASRKAGMKVALRPARLRRVHVAEVLKGVVEHLERGKAHYRPEWVVRLQVTYPFREAGFVDTVIKTVLAQDLDSAFVAFPEYDTFWHYGADGAPQRITTDVRVARARRTPIHRELGGLFSMVRRTVLSRGTMYGEKLGIIPIQSFLAAIDIHGVRGFELATIVAGVLQKRGRRRP